MRAHSWDIIVPKKTWAFGILWKSNGSSKGFASDWGLSIGHEIACRVPVTYEWTIHHMKMYFVLEQVNHFPAMLVYHRVASKQYDRLTLFPRIRWRLMDTFPHLFVEATSSLPSRAARLAAERLRQSQDFWLAICGCRVKFIFGVRSGGVFDCWKYTLPRCNPPKEVTDHHPKKRSPLESPRPLKKKFK